MPIYQYQCADCDYKQEVLQKMSDPRLTDCPNCKKPSFKKQITAAAFRLQGTGWYETDSKNLGKPPQAATPKDSDGSSENTVNSNSNEGSSSSKGSVSDESASSSTVA